MEKFDRKTLSDARKWIAQDLRAHLTDRSTVEGLSDILDCDCDSAVNLILMLAKKVESPSLTLHQAYEQRDE